MIVLDVFWMTLIIQKKSDYGTQHPAFARLAIQISELVEWSSLPKQDRTAIADLYADKLKTRFLRCDEILDRLKARLKQSCNEVGCEDQNPNVRVIPYVAGLDGEAESFAYEVKNFLRDLLAVFQIFFTCHLTDASAWYKSKGFGDSALVTWSARKFGDKDKLTELLRTDQPWCEEWIRLRNAIEHPGGKSGSVAIHNVRAHPEGLILPSWSRNGAPATDLFTHMEAAKHNMLTVAEDIFILSIEKTKAFPNIMFFEIPEEHRDPNAPQRFKVGLNPEFTKKMLMK